MFQLGKKDKKKQKQKYGRPEKPASHDLFIVLD